MMDRIAFSLFGVDIYWYGVIIAFGMLLGGALMLRREKRLGIPKDTSIDLLLITLPVALICARIYYVIFSWDLYRDDLWSVFDVRNGGLAIYGGVIGGFFVIWAFARRKKLALGTLLDLAAPSLALGQAIGRWGNFANGEAYGGVVAREWMAFFPMAVHIRADGLWHYATFFYESVWCLLIVIVLLLGEKRGIFRRKGDIFFWYAALYGAERAFVEGLRTDSLYFLGARVSQLLSAVLLAAVILWFVLRRKKADGKAWLAGAGAVCALAAPWFGAGWVTAVLLAAALCAAVGIYAGPETEL